MKKKSGKLKISLILLNSMGVTLATRATQAWHNTPIDLIVKNNKSIPL
jgi:hypothetical protein